MSDFANNMRRLCGIGDKSYCRRSGLNLSVNWPVELQRLNKKHSTRGMQPMKACISISRTVQSATISANHTQLSDPYAKAALSDVRIPTDLENPLRASGPITYLQRRNMAHGPHRRLARLQASRSKHPILRCRSLRSPRTLIALLGGDFSSQLVGEPKLLFVGTSLNCTISNRVLVLLIIFHLVLSLVKRAD
jgi:hypothetical protein